jgi:hypothetical protein
MVGIVVVIVCILILVSVPYVTRLVRLHTTFRKCIGGVRDMYTLYRRRSETLRIKVNSAKLKYVQGGKSAELLEFISVFFDISQAKKHSRYESFESVIVPTYMVASWWRIPDIDEIERITLYYIEALDQCDLYNTFVDSVLNHIRYTNSLNASIYLEHNLSGFIIGARETEPEVFHEARSEHSRRKFLMVHLHSMKHRDMGKPS